MTTSDYGYTVRPLTTLPGRGIALPPFIVEDYDFRVKFDRIVLIIAPERSLSGTPTTSCSGIWMRFSKTGAKSVSVHELRPEPSVSHLQRFKVTIQDPIPVQLAAAREELRIAFGRETTDEVQELEIAFDLFPKNPHDEAAVSRAVQHVRRHFAPRVIQMDADNTERLPRLQICKSTTLKLFQGFDDPPGFSLDEMPDQTFYIARSTKNGFFFKSYYKLVDRRGTKHERVLAPEERCIRLEMTAAGSGVVDICGGNTLDDLMRSRCRAAKRHFRFLLPVVPIDIDGATPFWNQLAAKRRGMVLKRWSEFGFSGELVGRYPPTTLKAGCRADETMQKAFHDAFSTLRWQLKKGAERLGHH